MFIIFFIRILIIATIIIIVFMKIGSILKHLKCHTTVWGIISFISDLVFLRKGSLLINLTLVDHTNRLAF